MHSLPPIFLYCQCFKHKFIKFGRFVIIPPSKSWDLRSSWHAAHHKVICSGRTIKQKWPTKPGRALYQCVFRKSLELYPARLRLLVRAAAGGDSDYLFSDDLRTWGDPTNNRQKMSKNLPTKTTGAGQKKNLDWIFTERFMELKTCQNKKGELHT